MAPLEADEEDTTTYINVAVVESVSTVVSPPTANGFAGISGVFFIFSSFWLLSNGLSAGLDLNNVD
jgi:hypothetical protein